MEPKVKNYDCHVPQRKGFSEKDIEKVNAYYGCENTGKI